MSKIRWWEGRKTETPETGSALESWKGPNKDSLVWCGPIYGRDSGQRPAPSRPIHLPRLPHMVRPTEPPMSGPSLDLGDLDCLLSLHQPEHLKHTELDLCVGVGAWQWSNRLNVGLVGLFKALLSTPLQYDF